MSEQLIQQAQGRMAKATDSLKRELATIRAGRANPSILDKVQMNYYGALSPLNQMAGISVPEARLLVIQPYDKSVINDMEKAILKADLGLSPTNDGNVIRLAIPALTEERRKELVKIIKKMAEEGKIAVRNIRRDVNDELKKSEKDSDITQDDYRRLTDDVQKMTDKYIKNIDTIIENKEKEIMEV